MKVFESLGQFAALETLASELVRGVYGRIVGTVGKGSSRFEFIGDGDVRIVMMGNLLPDRDRLAIEEAMRTGKSVFVTVEIVEDT